MANGRLGLEDKSQVMLRQVSARTAVDQRFSRASTVKVRNGDLAQVRPQLAEEDISSAEGGATTQHIVRGSPTKDTGTTRVEMFQADVSLRALVPPRTDSARHLA